MASNPFLDQGNWDIFDDTDGLGHEPFCLLQHSGGHLWIGTAEGLSRYDGRRFETYSRGNGIEGQVLALCEDGTGKLWLGTSEGLVCFDGLTFRTFTADIGRRRFVVRKVLANDDGTILCGTDVSGAFLFDGREFKEFGTDGGAHGKCVRAIFRDRDGHVHLGSELGLAKYEGSQCSLYTNKEGLGDGMVLAIHQDIQGRIWCGTESGGLSCLGRDGVVTFTVKDGLPDNCVNAILPYRDGMLCATTTGLCWFDECGFQRIGLQPGPAGRTVSAMALDREDGLWVASSHVGIARYNGDRIACLSDQGALEVILRDKTGELWWGGNGVLWHRTCDGRNRRTVLPRGEVNALLKDSKGRFWIGTSCGLLLADSAEGLGTDQISRVPVARLHGPGMEPYVWQIYEDRRGDIWIGVSDGIYRYDDGQLTKVLDQRLVSVIFEDRSGVVWFAGWAGGGLTGWDGRSWIKFPGEDRLPSDHVTSLIQDKDGGFWFGLSSGLCRLKDDTVRTFTTLDGLSGDFVQRLMLDRRGYLWIAHLGGGISVFDGQNFQTISTRDGLPSNGVTGLVEQDDGSVVIATYKGICRYVSNPVPPLVSIDCVDADREYSKPREVTISTAVPAIYIRFSGISFTTRQLRYRYLLEGHDSDWRTGSSEEVRYAGLDEGSYVFRVMAISRDLACSEDPAELKITVVKDPKDSRLDQLKKEVQEQTATLKAERELMDRVMYAMTDTIMIVNDAGIIKGTNAATRMLLGYAEDEIVGMKVDRLLSEAKGGQFKTLFGQGLVRNAHMTYFAKDGTAIPVVLSSFIVGDVDKAVICVARELSSSGETDADQQGPDRFSDALAKLERAEEEMIKNERLRALGEMSSGVAHDFNNALVPVLGYADILIHKPELLKDTAATMDMLKEIHRAARDAAQVVQNLRSFYAPAAEEQYDRIELNDLAKETIALTRPRWKEEMSANGVTISVETIFRGMPVINGNAPQLRTALTNLIFNAVEAMPRGGVITISTREGRAYHSIEVRDSGVGMTEDVRRRCFQPFFTTRGRHGSGLGLSMAYGIIRRHGGSVEVQSRPNHGTLMKVQLPATAAVGKVEKAGPARGVGTAHLRILVVDDEEPCLNMIAHYLRIDGHSFELARSGKDALEKFRSGGFDVVITDRAMPGMSGDVVAAEIRRSFPDTPVIMMTGFGNVLMDEENYPEGVDLILSKPLSMDDLRRVLADLRQP